MTLRYTGRGDYIPAVPARNLDDEDIEVAARLFGLSVEEAIERLIASGIYLALQDYTVETQNVSAVIEDEPEDEQGE